MISENLIKKATGFALVGVLIIILAGSVPAAAQASGGTSPSVVDINHKQTIDSNESFETEIKTSNSVGTVVLVESQDFKTNVSSTTGFVDGNRVEFVDPSVSNSTYTVTITVIGSEEGDSGSIVAWVGAEKKASAVDEQVSSFQIDQSENDDGFDQNSGDGSSDESNNSNQTNAHNDSDDTNETRNLTESDDTDQDETVDTTDSENASSTSINGSNHSENSSMTSVDDSVPGFGIILAVASYLIAGFLMNRKRT